MAYSGTYFPDNPIKYRGDVKNIIYRSLWERTVMVKLDHSKLVEEWTSEELRIPYRSPLDNKIKQYFPDFVLKIRTPSGLKTGVVEVKPLKQCVEPKKPKKVTKAYVNAVTEYIRNQAKWEAARAYCVDRGWEFIILTENDIYGDLWK